MAKEIVNRQVSIVIESGAAQRAYDQLIKKEKELNAELAKTTNPKQMEALRNQIAALQEPISRAAKKVSGELEPSLKDVQAAAARLRNELARMSESDAGYAEKVAMYRKANLELEQQRGKVGLLANAWKSFWQEAKTVAVGVIIGNTLQSALQTVMGYVTGIITGSAKIADELSDIEKTTGLTTDQVKELNRELGKIDTRTSRSDLRQLATEAGKLGYESAPEILKFVDAADKIRVALKEDLGEGAILDIAKASKIFGVEMLNMASAINEIGASSSASEAFSVDFIKRTGGVAATVKIAAGDILGYSSALEQAGQTTEVSATALNTFFLDFISNSDKFGKAAGFAKGELAGLIGTQGTNEGFLQWLQRLKEANPTAAGFISALKELGIDGARGSNVMLTLANNIATVREQQNIANTAIQSNSSIMDEFNKKNNNAAAELAKFKKNLAGMFESQTFMDAGAQAIKIMNGLVNVVKSSVQFIKEHGGLIATLGTVYALLTVRLKLATAGTWLQIAATKTATVVSAAWSAAVKVSEAIVNLFTGKVNRLTSAKQAFAAVSKLGVGALGLFITAVGATIIAIQSLWNRTKQLNAEQLINAELSKRVADATAETVNKTELYIKIASDEKRTLEEKKSALDALIKQAPDVLSGLTLQNLKTAEGTEILKGYVEGLKKRAEAEAKFSLLNENTKRKAELLSQVRLNVSGYSNMSDEEILKAFNKLQNYSTGKLDFVQVGGVRLGDIRNAVASIELLGKDLQNVAVESIKPTTNETNNLITTVKDLGNESDKTSGKITNSKDDYAELIKELKKIRDELSIAQLSPFERDLLELDIKFAALRERAKGNTKTLVTIDELYAKSRVSLIQEYARKEVDAWQKSTTDINKKAEESFKKSLEALIKIEERLSQEIEKRFDRFDRNRLAGKELAVLQARGKKRLEAELELLNQQEQAELNAKDLTENEKLLIEEKYRQKRYDAEQSFFLSQINAVKGFVLESIDIISIFNESKTNQENAELERDQFINDKKKRNLDQRLKAGQISQVQYNREIEKLDKEREAKEKAFATRQFKRNQALAIAQAVVNGAQGIVSTFAARPGLADVFTLGAARAIQVALITASTIAQIKAISSQKPQYGKGGKLDGWYHSQGGNPILDGSGRVIGNIEKDEGIINRFTMGDRNQYSVTGTPSQIASTLNGLHGGRQWDRSARLVPLWATRQPAAMNFANIHRYFAAGGKFSTSSETTAQAAAADPMYEMLATVLQRLDNRLSSIEANGIYAYTLVTENEKAQKRLDDIRKDATIPG